MARLQVAGRVDGDLSLNSDSGDVGCAPRAVAVASSSTSAWKQQGRVPNLICFQALFVCSVSLVYPLDRFTMRERVQYV